MSTPGNREARPSVHGILRLPNRHVGGKIGSLSLSLSESSSTYGFRPFKGNTNRVFHARVGRFFSRKGENPALGEILDRIGGLS